MEKRYITICSILLFLIAVLFLMHPIIFPCITSIVIAYLFNPLVLKLEKYKLPRLYSVILIMFILSTILILIIILVLPVIYVQIINIIDFLGNKIPLLKNKVIPYLLEFCDMKFDNNLFSQLSKNLTDNYDDYLIYIINAFKVISNFLTHILSSSFSLVHTMSLLVITPIIFFYVLRDLPFFIEKMNNLIPIPYRKEVKDYFLKVDFIISNYLRGQVNICIIMMIFYSVGLNIIGLKHSIAMGVLSGILTFVPYMGSLLYSTIGFLSAITQFSEWVKILSVLVLFLVGQIIDANILVPFLIGRKVHMHPVTIILGIALCTSYFGFIGILLFIPIIAIINVSLSIAFNKYCQSLFYKQG
ncbi:MAG: AI-2E family transporter [Wolbachia endosymbiont of Fragariocoptes setiger]|nr:AI-2E family transporter [Wolbachia endosymbiont of Fragariocoptes setiger]